jgi:16S rRNA (uracil1498-N3)-methyltransferase
MPRIYLDEPIAADADIVLPAAQARHVQVLRLQPGEPLTLFDGRGGEWSAVVTRMERASVTVRCGRHMDVDRELTRHVTLAIGMPANERMDALIEKATELGVAAIQPLVCERSVLRLRGERATRRLDHWRGIAIAASEQSGRTQVPTICEVQTLRSLLEATGAVAPRSGAAVVPSPELASAAPAAESASAGRLGHASQPLAGSTAGAHEIMAWTSGSVSRASPDGGQHRSTSSRAAGPAPAVTTRLMLSPSAASAWTLASLGPADACLVVLSGPEGGLSSGEEEQAREAGFLAVSLGARILRADTAPLAVLAACGLGLS